MRNSEKRKVKRSFLRPKASAILGLEKEGPISMQNTISTNNNRVELLLGGSKDAQIIMSSGDNSSVEQNQMNPKLGKDEFLLRITEVEAKKAAAGQAANNSV